MQEMSHILNTIAWILVRLPVLGRRNLLTTQAESLHNLACDLKSLLIQIQSYLHRAAAGVYPTSSMVDSPGGAPRFETPPRKHSINDACTQTDFHLPLHTPISLESHPTASANVTMFNNPHGEIPQGGFAGFPESTVSAHSPVPHPISTPAAFHPSIAPSMSGTSRPDSAGLFTGGLQAIPAVPRSLADSGDVSARSHSSVMTDARNQTPFSTASLPIPVYVLVSLTLSHPGMNMATVCSSFCFNASFITSLAQE